MDWPPDSRQVRNLTTGGVVHLWLPADASCSMSGQSAHAFWSMLSKVVVLAAQGASRAGRMS
jgi:hypothetical protein